jgi:UDP-GlcNAc:undecaprenyl-phosphate GlcNAc-1-phosphate transferase
MIFLSFPVSLIASLLLVPVVRWVSFRLGRVSQPRADRWHRSPTPTLGGIGIFTAFGFTILLIGGLGGWLGELRWSLLAGSALMFALGLLDDLRRLTPPAKLVIQVLAAAVVIFFGRVIDFFPWGFANVILTFFWLVGITNAINLLDNMDGLAGGVAFIAAAFLSYFFWGTGSEALLLISLALAGGLLGFLVFNFPPAKIFMGDSGSLFLGFTLAALAVAHRPRASDVFSVMGVPILLFLLPILDTTLVTITRLLRGQSPAQGGTDHTSHRLIAFGLSERQAVLILYGIGILSGITGAVLEALNYDLSLVLIPILLISLSLLTAYLGRLKVVSSTAFVPGNITRIMADLTYKRRLLEMILDFFLIGVSYYLAFWTQIGFQMNDLELELFLKTSPIALAGAYVAFFIFGVYRGFWRYVGVEDLLLFARASLGAVILTAVPALTLYSTDLYSPVIFFLYAVFLFLALAASRSSFRILDRIYGRRQTQLGKIKVLIYGAEDAGEIALRWILLNPGFGYWPVGFLDDDPFKWGRRIHGFDVLGGRHQIEAILANTGCAGLILTSQAQAKDGAKAEIMETCRKNGIWVKVLRLDFEQVE